MQEKRSGTCEERAAPRETKSKLRSRRTSMKRSGQQPMWLDDEEQTVEAQSKRRGTSRATRRQMVASKPRSRALHEVEQGDARRTRQTYSRRHPANAQTHHASRARHASQDTRDANEAASFRSRSNAHASLKQRSFDRASRFIDTRFD
jgi:hypothetical protein